MDFISYAIAVGIPALAIYLIFALDVFGSGKGSTVYICLAWGAIGAFSLALITNRTVANVLDVEFEVISRFVAPVMEEIYKLLILLYFVQRPRFRYFVDGAVYGYAAGIGFAMTENLFYLNSRPDAGIVLAVSRALSATLMHATASAAVGISLGLGRRARQPLQRILMPFMGVLFAVVVHFIYNNALFELQDTAPALLLPVAIGIGVGGSVLIGYFINRGLIEEKRRFEKTLGLGEGVSSAERKAVQQLGGEVIDEILQELAGFFGEDKADLIRKMLIKQANIGILRNNLNSPASERLQQAWRKEIDDLRLEIDHIRAELGVYVMGLLRSFLPDDDSAEWDDFNQRVIAYDPTHVHSFDLFISASQVANTFTAEQLESLSNRLAKIDFFKNVPLHDLENLCRAIKPKRFIHGHMLFDKGDKGDSMFMIERGYIDLYIQDQSGEYKWLRTLTAGAVVGELALLDGAPRSARAIANGPLQVLELQRNHFTMFTQSRPQVTMAVLKFLAEKVRYTTDAVRIDLEEARPKIRLFENPEEFNLPDPDMPTEVHTTEPLKGIYIRIAEALEIREKSKLTNEGSSPS